MTYVRPNNRFTYSPILFYICIVKHFVLAEEGQVRELMRYSITRSAEDMMIIVSHFLSVLPDQERRVLASGVRLY